MIESPLHHAAGANIRGTPAMPAEAVRHDLKVLRKRASVLMLQEFKWPWYWTAAARVLDDRLWGSSPGFARGKDRSVLGAQGITWDAKKWRRVRTLVWPSFNFDVSTAGIMDNRWIRAVLLEDRKTKQRCWFLSTHFVVGGDRRGDSARRRSLLWSNIAHMDIALGTLINSGYPIIGELDANIGRDSEMYEPWMKMLNKHDIKVVGTHGIEFLLVRHGKTTKIKVERDWIIPITQLRTDHETRGITFRLVG